MVPHPSLGKRKYFHAVKNHDGSTTLDAYDRNHEFRYRLVASRQEMTHLGPAPQPSWNLEAPPTVPDLLYRRWNLRFPLAPLPSGGVVGCYR
jgi:hypothetical protein